MTLCLSLPARLRRGALLVAAIAASGAAVPSGSTAQLRRTMPDSLTNREFWQIFTTMSEESGNFPSENFVSNEQTFQHVIPSLQRSLTRGGVYLGVGPEQNFTYIANLEPRLAVIFDIRRQNGMAHLMYKALFELSPTRAEFVSRLFSRQLPASLATSAPPAEIFAAAMNARASDSTFDANWTAIVDRLTVKHGFALSDDDLRSIRHVYTAFFEAGPEINYGYRLGMLSSTFAPRYATFASLQSLTNADGVNMAFLANETNYQRLRAMHGNNMIVPVVGNFSGPKAIRAVGAFLRERGATVTAFYLSNVEQYLFRGNGDAERFYRNVETLPLDSTSMFIRSVPSNDGMFTGGAISIGSNPQFASPTTYYSVQVVDSAGRRIITTTADSAGRTVTTRTVDSSATQSAVSVFRSLRARDDSLLRARVDTAMRNLGRDSLTLNRIVTGRPPFSVSRDNMVSMVVAGGVLVSGTASIRASLDALLNGQLSNYAQAIAMTKISGWTQPR